MSGTKFDGDKPDLSLIPGCFKREVAFAMMEGERKYGRWNYTQGLEMARLLSAAERHLDALKGGEWLVPDSIHHKFSHAGAIAANMVMLLHCRELGTLIDEKRLLNPPTPPAPVDSLIIPSGVNITVIKG
jgi:hypothetical protein